MNVIDFIIDYTFPVAVGLLVLYVVVSVVVYSYFKIRLLVNTIKKG